MMKHLKFTILILFVWGGLAVAESWTNVAGHSIEAELVSRKGDSLTMKRENGSTFMISIKSLSKESQNAADEKLPPKPALTHDERVLQRNEQRLKQLSEEQVRKAESSAE